MSGKEEVLYRAGRRGSSVCLVLRPGSRNLYLRWWDPTLREGKGNWRRVALEHEDRSEGEDAADDAAKILRRGGSPAKESGPTLAELLASYRLSRTVRKKEKQQKSDEHRIGLFLDFWGGARPAMEIDPDAVDAYTDWRREQGIGDTTIGHERVFLRGVYQWALTRRLSSGRALLPLNPVATVQRIRSTNPYTPVASPAIFQRVYRQANRVCRQKLFRDFLMLVHEHGWRLSAWCNLKFSDFNLSTAVLWPYGRVRKAWEHDKTGKGKWVPLTPRSRRAVERLLRRRKAIGNALVFPAPVAEGPWQPQHALDLLERCEKAATAAARRKDPEAEVVVLGGFHALRRKWASDRKGMELVDVAEAGDWHPATLLSHYMKPDPATTLRVTLRKEAKR